MDLAEFRRCPLRIADGVGYEDPYLAAAEAVWRHVALRAFHGQATDTLAIRVLFGKTPGLSAVKVARMARRLSELLLRWRVVQPVTPYTLQVDRVAVSGEYAVVTAGKRDMYYAVCLALGGQPMRGVVDTVARRLALTPLLRAWHLSHYGVPGRAGVRALVFHLLDDRHFRQSYRTTLVRRELDNLARGLTDAGTLIRARTAPVRK